MADSAALLISLEALKARVAKLDLAACTQRLAELNGTWSARPDVLHAEAPEFKAYHRAASLHAQEKELLRSRIVGLQNPVTFSDHPRRPLAALPAHAPRLRQ